MAPVPVLGLCVLVGCAIGVNVTFDRRSLLFDGERELWLAGSIHYPRFTPSQWPHVFEMAKTAGLTAITSYVFWNVHQPHNSSHFDFSGRKNLTAFLDAAQSAGLRVHLRVGPYIDGEWFNGGLPWWLRNVPGCVARQNDAVWKGRMETWIKRLLDEVRPFLASRGGPVAMWQVENELSGGDDDTVHYAEWALRTAVELTPDDIVTFCNNSGSPTLSDDYGGSVIFTGNAFCWGGSCDPKCFFDEWGHWRQYPDQPAIWTEVEQGFRTFANNGWSPRAPSVLAHNLARWFSLGGSGMSLYMFDGGNDFGLTAGDDEQTAYCPSCAVEPVFQQPQAAGFYQLQGLVSALREFSDELLGAAPPAPVVPTGSAGVEVRTYVGKKRALTFVGNMHADQSGTAVIGGVTLAVNASSHLLVVQTRSGTAFGAPSVVYDTSSCVRAGCDSTALPPPTVTTVAGSGLSWQFFAEQPLQDSSAAVSAAGPLDILALNHWTSDYAWYTKHSVQLPPAPVAASVPAVGTFKCGEAQVLEEQWHVSFTAARPISWANDTEFCLGIKAGSSSLSLVGCTAGDRNAAAVVPCWAYNPSSQLLSTAPCTGGDLLHSGCLTVDEASASSVEGHRAVLATCSGDEGAFRWNLSTQQNPLPLVWGVADAATGRNMCVAAVGAKPKGAEARVGLFAQTTASVFVQGQFAGFFDNAVQNGNSRLVELEKLAGLPSAAVANATVSVLAQSMGLSADRASGADDDVSYVGMSTLGVTVRGRNLSAASESSPWIMQAALSGELLSAPEGGSKDVQWRPAAQAPGGSLDAVPAVWLRTTFDAPSGWAVGGAEPLAVDLAGACKGHVYVNGFDAGKYWVRGGTAAGSQRYYQLPQDALKLAGNKLVLFEELGLTNATSLRVVRATNQL
jgi:hypothetical protein